MGQSDILELLEKVKKPLCRREIAELLEQAVTQVSHHLRTLCVHNEIKIIELDRIQAKTFFKDKAPSRRMRLYYV